MSRFQKCRKAFGNLGNNKLFNKDMLPWSFLMIIKAENKQKLIIPYICTHNLQGEKKREREKTRCV